MNLSFQKQFSPCSQPLLLLSRDEIAKIEKELSGIPGMPPLQKTEDMCDEVMKLLKEDVKMTMFDPPHNLGVLPITDRKMELNDSNLQLHPEKDEDLYALIGTGNPVLAENGTEMPELRDFKLNRVGTALDGRNVGDVEITVVGNLQTRAEETKSRNQIP
jgi:hypothetical protein